MATYRVPQDVEADDKLIGPFGFRQFVYLIIVALSGAAAWGLAQIFIGLAIIPLPVIVLFGALALPLRKDQPMEIYLAAMVSFYLKPRRRIWDPEGVESLIEITAPKVVEVRRTKDLSQTEAEQRLSYLANIVDSGGWAIRGVGSAPNMAVNNDVYLEAQGVDDVLDTTNNIGRSFDTMMAQRTEQVREDAVERMHQLTMQAATPVAEPLPLQPVATTVPVTPAPVAPPTELILPTPEFNPYPSDIHQSVVQPISPQQAAQSSQLLEDALNAAAPPADEPTITEPTSTSDTTVSADIINLANNPDLSVATIAHEANRLETKGDDSEEIVLSLR